MDYGILEYGLIPESALRLNEKMESIHDPPSEVKYVASVKFSGEEVAEPQWIFSIDSFCHFLISKMIQI